jgi:phosphatidylglycerophosphatase A
MAATSEQEPSGGTPWFDPAVFVATCGGLGRIPFAPGTFGAALGVAASVALASSGISPEAEAALVIAVNLVGVPICTAAARRLGRGEDPGAINYDEMASAMLGLLVVPAAARASLPAALPLLAVAFLLHRVFDVAKPFPCRQLEHLPEGLGIMADDAGAALWMAVILIGCRWAGWL